MSDMERLAGDVARIRQQAREILDATGPRLAQAFLGFAAAFEGLEAAVTCAACGHLDEHHAPAIGCFHWTGFDASGKDILCACPIEGRQ